jgi:predicted MFS family arabinose efflux permease
MARAVSERGVVYLMAAVQFVNVLDFMMVSPLGPDFADALAIPISELPLVAGAYTASAAIAGVGGSFFLERFDRKKALVTALVGLALGTFLGGVARGMATLLAARVLAGAFGGPATSLAIAIIADAIPHERRGRAMGIVMGGFSLASSLGVPAGLKLAELGGWRTTFFGVAALIAIVTLYAARALPNFTAHIGRLDGSRGGLASLGRMLREARVLLSLSMTALANVGGFILILNFPAYVEFNLGFPRSDLDELYFLGGLASLVTMRFAGKLVDALGSTRVASLGTLALLGIIYVGFVRALDVAWVIPVFVGFFIASAFRNVAYSTLTSKVPEQAERARFLSIPSAVQHAASAAAAGLATKLLSERPDKSLEHIGRASVTSMVLVGLVPIAMFFVERMVRAAPPLSVRPPLAVPAADRTRGEGAASPEG